MSAQKLRSKAEVREHLLVALEDILDDPEVKTGPKLKAIELFGREFGIFVEQKKINIDVNTIVRHFTDAQLTNLIGDKGGIKQLGLETVNPADSVDYLDTDSRVIPSDDGV